MMKTNDSKDLTLRIGWFIPDSELLGPGKRFVLWVQGCQRSCRGCIAESLKDLNGGKTVSVKDIAHEFLTSGTSGLTISGGEPFLQARALNELIKLIRKDRPETDVIIFTGFVYEKLKEDPDAALLLEQTDLLVDGEYITELDDNKPMRGSSNQRMIFLTDRLSADNMPKKRNNKLVFNGNKYMMIGIPSNETKTLMNILKGERN